MALVRIFDVKSAFFLGLALLSCGVECARRGLVDNGATVFDVTKYGAKADGKTENAQAFIQAWNAACESKGAANVVIPQGTYLTGEVFFHGPCNFSNPITIEVQGTLLAQPDLSEFANGPWVTIQNVDGLVVQGGGTFNGQGEASWQYDACGGNATCDYPLPPSIVFDKVNNSIIQGITMVNSKGFNIKIGGSHNFTVQNLNITAPIDSPNTDGIHIKQSDLVTITNSTITTGGHNCISVDEEATHISISAVNCGPRHT